MAKYLEDTRLGHTATGASAETVTRVRSGNKRPARGGKPEEGLKESDNRFTSPDLIGAVQASFGEIDFDPCWHKASAVHPKSYLDVREGHDGLRDDWSGPLAFVNPPWSNQKKWVERAYDQWLKRNVKTVVCLVPSQTGTDLFHDTLAQDADIYFLRKRPRFFKEDKTSDSATAPVMIIMFGATYEQKVRFAERVDGSYCLLSRIPSVRSDTSDAGSHDVPSDRNRGFYVAPALRRATNPASRSAAQYSGSPSPATLFSDCRPGPSARVLCGPT